MMTFSRHRPSNPETDPMPSRNFASKYRPENFGAVRGQPHPVRFLAGLIKHGQRARPLLLHGAIGSGKTSLVRIYAKALNCEIPMHDGSPCRECRSCRAEVGFHEYDTSGCGGDYDSVLDWVAPRSQSPRGYRWNVLFFDEAQALENRAADALLKMVEEPKPGVTFCFATTEFERIRPALRSRLIGFEIEQLSATESITLLEECAAAEGIEHEPGALALLAGLRGGYARDLLNGLEQVHDPDRRPVTVERVREVFDVDHTEHLLAYGRALATGDLTAQQRAWFGWNEIAATKLGWLQALLTALYYNDVLGQTLTVDPLIASLLPSERTPIVTGLQNRLGVASPSELAPYWRALMAFWPIDTVDLSETALQLGIALFHDFVNRELPTLERPETVGCKGRAQETARATATCVKVSEPSASHLPTDGRDRLLTIEDVRNVIASASYFTQEYGGLFNASIMLEPALIGIDEEVTAAALVQKFCGELEAEVASWSDGPFARLSLIERDLARGGQVAGRILVHLPDPKGPGRSIDAATRITAWARLWRRDAWCEGRSPAVVTTPATAKARPSTFHWNGVLNLCAGLRNEAEEMDPVRDELVPLLDLLRIERSRRRMVGGIAAQLVGRSDLLGPRAMREACLNGMSFLSAFDSKQWDHIRSGWELAEYKDRLRLKVERASALARITAAYGDSIEGQARRGVLTASWQAPPEERQRRAWRGWWLPKEI